MSGANKPIETDVLIVGAGPAGATAASLLSTYGIDNIMINKFGAAARTPRAHITNQRAMEVFRDLGLEDEVARLAVPKELMGEHVFCLSMAGEELGRINSWGTHPNTRARHELSSPCNTCDLPQHLLEPILVEAAAARGSRVRRNTEYLSHDQDADGVTTTLNDRLTGQACQVRSRYLIGADGGNSKVAEDIGLPMEGRMGISGQFNFVFQADLSEFVLHRPGIMYWILQPGPGVGGMAIGVLRMVRPWDRWVAVWGYDVAKGAPDLNEEMGVEIIHRLIGRDDVPINIDSISTWTINDVYALENTRGRVFCVGDAVHRHPPTNGLGSNTSVHDAYNLCWKLALVLRGQAGPSLLESYDAERSPVARQIVKRAMQSIEELIHIPKALGMLGKTDAGEIIASIEERKAQTPEGAAKRKALREAIDLTRYDFDCHGVEMNQRYDSGAVVPDGTPDPGFSEDPELISQPTSRPGAFVPHAWLTRNGHRISTLDLCGGGKFSVLTGTGGEQWVEAARQAEKVYDIAINTHVIGPGKPVEDAYGYFAETRETEEDGVLLVRPDRVIGWRCSTLTGNPGEDLLEALEQILGK